jgi:hypothetical protein
MTDWDMQWQEKITKVVRRVAKDLIANDETEISEVARRRLFEDLGSERVRKNVATAFADWCFERRAQLPPEPTAVDTSATEAKAREFLRKRLKACCPFGRLRARGVPADEGQGTGAQGRGSGGPSWAGTARSRASPSPASAPAPASAASAAEDNGPPRRRGPTRDVESAGNEGPAQAPVRLRSQSGHRHLRDGRPRPGRKPQVGSPPGPGRSRPRADAPSR